MNIKSLNENLKNFEFDLLLVGDNHSSSLITISCIFTEKDDYLSKHMITMSFASNSYPSKTNVVVFNCYYKNMKRLVHEFKVISLCLRTIVLFLVD